MRVSIWTVPLVSAAWLILAPNANGDTVATVGDPVIARALHDGDSSGAIFILNISLAAFADPANFVKDWSFFDDDRAGYVVTPLLFSETGFNQFTVSGIGTTRTSDASGAQSFEFGLVSGSSTVGPASFFGYRNGSAASTSIPNNGPVEYENGPGPGIRFSGDPGFGPVNVGDQYSASTFGFRIYSLQFTIANANTSTQGETSTVPEPASALLLGTSIAVLVRRIRRRSPRALCGDSPRA